MFLSPLDLITGAATNSLFIFCFCNFIIVLILIGSKPTINLDQDIEIPPPIGTNKIENHNQELYDKHSTRCSEAVSNGQEEHCHVDVENGENDAYDDDDELRRRIEDFIAKVNQGWKAELLSTSQSL